MNAFWKIMLFSNVWWVCEEKLGPKYVFSQNLKKFQQEV